MQRIAVIFLGLLCLGGASTQPATFFDYDGEWDGRPIGMTLQADGVGCYFQYDQCKDISVEGIRGGADEIDGKIDGKPFHVRLTFTGSWELGKRYAAAGFDDERPVNDLMARFREAVLNREVDAAVTMVRFPIKVWINGKRTAVDTEAFRNSFDQILRRPFVEHLRGSPPFHMFARDQGVMLGSGAVWVAPVDGKPMVIAINNDIGSRHAK